MNNGGRYHFGIIGAENEVRIAAFGSSMLVQPDENNTPKAWTCSICTFHNAETLGRFCSMCGNARAMGQGSGVASNENLDDGGGKPKSRDHGISKNRRPHFDDFDDGPAYTLSPEQNPRQNRSVSMPNIYVGQQSLMPPSIVEQALPPPPPPPPIVDEDYQRDQPSSAITPRSRQAHAGGGITPKINRRGREMEGGLQHVPEASESLEYDQPSQQLHESFDFRGDDSWTRRTPATRRAKSLDGSFSVLNLLREGFDEEGSPQGKKPAAKLSDKDFMMSFANWSVSDQGAWACVACTYLNTNPLHLTCEVCGQKRPNSKNAANECQKAMQDAFETSIRTGQDDFMKRQQEKIEEVEERVLAAERVDEIMEIQEELMDEFNEFGNNHEDEYQHGNQYEDQREKATLAQEWIGQLEHVRKQERDEQERVEEALAMRRRQLNIDRTPSHNFATNQGPLPGSRNPEELEVRAQEQMLSQWKQQYDSRADDIEKIRNQQRQIHERLHGGYHS